jgi:hypothetical protein
MLHCTYVVTTCDINKFVIMAARDSAVQRSRTKHVLSLVPTLAALGFVGEGSGESSCSLPVQPWGSGPGSRLPVGHTRRLAGQPPRAQATGSAAGDPAPRNVVASGCGRRGSRGSDRATLTSVDMALRALR